MSAVMTAPAVPATNGRCSIEDVFGSAFIDLIALAPKNPVVRGLILAQTRRIPGPECETFEQIKEWVETTCEKILRPPNQPNGMRTPSRNGIVIKVDFSEVEYGRANYSVERSGSDEFALDEDELVAMIREAIEEEEGVNSVVDTIASLIDDEAWDRCDPNLEDYGDYDYDNHDSESCDNSSTEYSRTVIRDRLLAFLRQRHPQLLEELT